MLLNVFDMREIKVKGVLLEVKWSRVRKFMSGMLFSDEFDLLEMEK